MSAQPVETVEGSLDPDSAQGHDEGLTPEPAQLEVRRNAVVSALLGAAASATAIAYLWRAAATGHPLDWVLCAALGVLGAVFLHSLLDARTPLLAVDEMGVRIRLGTTWRGLPWEAIERVVVRPRRGFLRDGALVVQLSHVARTLEGLEGRARRHALLNRKAYGGALAVPLGLATRISGSDEELRERIAVLSQGRAEVVTLLPTPSRDTTEAAGADSAEPGAVPDDVATATVDAVEADEPASPATTEPAQDEVVDAPAGARRGWLRRRRRPVGDDPVPEVLVEHLDDAAHDLFGDPDPDRAAVADPALLDPAPLLLPGVDRAVPMRQREADESVTLRVDEPSRSRQRGIDAVASMREAVNPVGRNDSRVRAIARLGDPVAPLVIEDYQPEPAYDPVIGPELAASRTRVGLSVDELAERTRIRPHVIESIEVDDFTPCGGDFYARGHIRTLSRVLGKDPVPLLEVYEARYAHAPVNARKVFEAELATGMGGQMTRPYGGPNWTGLVVAVLLLVLVWAGVRLFAGEGELMEEPPPVLDGVAGLSGYAPVPDTAEPVSTVLTVITDEVEVEVRDADGRLVLDELLAAGDQKRLRVLPPVTVTSDVGTAVRVEVAGRDKGLLGADDGPATRTFTAPTGPGTD